MPESNELLTSPATESARPVAGRPPIRLRSLDEPDLNRSLPSTADSPVVRGDQVSTRDNPRVRIPAGGGGEPRVELVHDGGTVVAIDVYCCCGQKLRLVCDYDR